MNYSKCRGRSFLAVDPSTRTIVHTIFWDLSGIFLLNHIFYELFKVNMLTKEVKCEFGTTQNYIQDTTMFSRWLENLPLPLTKTQLLVWFLHCAMTHSIRFCLLGKYNEDVANWSFLNIFIWNIIFDLEKFILS